MADEAASTRQQTDISRSIHRETSNLDNRWALAALVAVIGTYVAFALAWNWITLAYEGFDEPYHVAYVETILQSGHLPRMPNANLEGHQPPAYYVLQAALLRITGLPPPPAARLTHPLGRWAYYVHTGECHLCDGMLTLRLMRGLSTALGVVTLVLTYLAASLVLRSRWWAVTAVATVAFIPEFQFITALVNNDSLSYALGALTCLFAALMARRRYGVYRSAALLGASIGAGLLAKEYAFALLPVVPVALAMATESWRRRIGGAVVAGIAALVVVGPLLVRNWFLYNELWPFQAERANIGRIFPASIISRPPWDPLYWTSMPKNMWGSFWYYGAWGQIRFPDALYLSMAAVLLPAIVIGITLRLRYWSRLGLIERGPAVLLAIAPLCLYAGAYYSALTILQFPGRYLFAALPGIGVLFTLPLLAARTPLRRALLVGMPALELVFSGAAVLLAHGTYYPG